MRKHLLHISIIIAALLCLTPAWRLLAAPTVTVIGDGTPASCTAGALAVAVAAGGAVTFACGAAPVTITTSELTIATGQDVTIDGGNLVTLNGGGVNRHFKVEAGASLTLRALVLTDGAVTGSGGAIHNEGQVTLDQVTLRNNRAEGDPLAGEGSGGAILSSGAVEIVSSRLIANRAIDMGGAIALITAMPDSTPSLRIDDAHFEDNVSGNGGGAAYLEGNVLILASRFISNVAPAGGGLEFGPTGEYILRDSSVARNQADTDLGGGIYIVGGATQISGSIIEENSSLGGGGGVYINPNYGATVTISDSAIRRNRTLGQNPPHNLAMIVGGGIYNGATLLLESVQIEGNEAGEAAGLFSYSESSHLTVQNSAIVGNRATNVAGGLWSSSADVQRFVNVTLSGNHASAFAGGAYFSGGPVALTHVTLANNQALDGANLHLTDAAAVTLTNSIVASPVDGPNCTVVGAAAQLQSGGANIASDDSCALTETGDLTATDPLLGALAANGGATLTHLPQPGSPAIDRAPLAACPSIDQRGFLRPVGAACDSGAVEVGALAPPPPPTATPTLTATPTTPPPSPTPSAIPTLPALPADFVPAQPPNAQPPTVQIAPVSAAPGVTVTVSGVNASGATAVRLQWQFGGAMFFAANEATEPGGAFSTALAVPNEGIVGPGRLCAAALDVPTAAFACADFTIDTPAAGAIDGQIAPEALPPAVRGALPAAVNLAINVKLLNQAGTTVAMAPVTNAGKFLMNNIPPGAYQLAAVGDLAKPVDLTNVTVVGGSIIRPMLPYLKPRTSDPVDGSACDNDDAATAAISAKYAFSGKVSWGTARALDPTAPLLANQLLLNDLHRFRIPQTFGIYLSGVGVDNEFTAEAQSLSVNRIVAMNFRIVANGVKLLDVNRPAPYVAGFNVGLLPAGRHKIYVAPVVQRGASQVRQCPMEKEILVTDSPVNLATVANRQENTVSSGFNPTTGQYSFDKTLPPYSYSAPNQPTNYPYVGDLQSIVRAGARLSGSASLSGACSITNAYINGFVQAAGEPLCNPTVDLRGGNNTCIVDPLNPGKTTYTISGKNICAPRIDKVRFEGDLFNFLDLVSVRLKIALRLDANVLLFSRLKPFAPELYTSIFADARPTVAGSLRLNFLRVLRPHARLTADGVSWIQPRVTVNKTIPPASVNGCAAAQLYLTLWLEGIIGPQYFALADRTECININTARQAQPQPLTPQQAAELGLDPGPRVFAAPALASAPDGRMLSVVVEDTTPDAERAAPALFARFWNPTTQSWSDAVPISDADRMVNDPTATFYGANGEQALVAWSQIELTPAETTALGNDFNAILSHQEIYFARWDGTRWLPPQRLTDDLVADGLATLAGDASGATLAWTRDADGDLATTLDSVIAVSDWNRAALTWDAPTYLSAGDGAAVVTAAAQAAGATPAPGMNYDVAIDRKYYAGLDRSRTVVALTFDADGDFSTGDDRTVRIFQRDFDAVQVNPQPLPPKEWVLVNPQPLPPRIQTPTIALDRGNLNAIKLAFVQADAVDAEGGVAGIDQPGALWSADMRRTIGGWQTIAAPLLDQGVVVRGEEPRMLSGPNGAASLVFRRFDAASETASVGQIALSSGIIIEGGRTVYGAPVALTASAGAQQWMPAATLNPVTNALLVSSVRRILTTGAASTSSSEKEETASATSLTFLTVANDPVTAIVIQDRGDPALDQALELDRIHAPVGATVQVTAHGRNLGRRAVDVTVRFLRGAPGSGVQVGQIVIGSVAAGAAFSATLPLTVQMGDQPVYAAAVSTDNASSANDVATGNLTAMPPPTISTVDGENALANSLLVVVEQPAAEDLAGFRLLRSLEPDGPFVLTAEITEPLYLDLGLTAGANYCYRAQVYDTRGNLSPLSQSVCGTVNVYRLFLPSVRR